MKLLNPDPHSKNVLPEVAAFAIGLGAAWYQQWQVPDLVWSLWLCSLVLGYATMLAAMLGTIVEARLAEPGWHKVAGASAFSLFMLGFFSLHFGGFHAGHAGFLNSFFPLEGVPDDVFFDGFMNPVALWGAAIQYVAPAYWPFLIAVIIAERQQLFRAFRGLRDMDEASSQGHEAGPVGPQLDLIKKVFARPYLNVIRMHLLIFSFAGAHIAGLDSLWVFSAVYLVYFFPWRLFRSREQKQAVPA